MIRLDILERREDILNWIEANEPKAEMARRLACKIDTLNSYLSKMDIDYKGNQGSRGKKTDSKRKTAEELSKNPLCSSHKMRNRLIEDNIKLPKCEQCNLTLWLGKAIPLELHHKDGNHYNNTLDNLEILCPNCHAQTSSYSCRK